MRGGIRDRLLMLYRLSSPQNEDLLKVFRIRRKRICAVPVNKNCGVSSHATSHVNLKVASHDGMATVR